MKYGYAMKEKIKYWERETKMYTTVFYRGSIGLFICITVPFVFFFGSHSIRFLYKCNYLLVNSELVGIIRNAIYPAWKIQEMQLMQHGYARFLVLHNLVTLVTFVYTFVFLFFSLKHFKSFYQLIDKNLSKKWPTKPVLGKVYIILGLFLGIISTFSGNFYMLFLRKFMFDGFDKIELLPNYFYIYFGSLQYYLMFAVSFIFAQMAVFFIIWLLVNINKYR